MLPTIISLIAMVALLLWMFFLVAGGLPLLVLKHDTPTDSQFVRSLFNVHYLVLVGIAAVGVMSSVLSDHRLQAIFMAFIGLIGFTARRAIVSRMDQLRITMSATDTLAIRRFRWLHVTGLVLNVLLLVGLFSSLILSPPKM